MNAKKSEREDCLARAKTAEDMAARFADGFYKVSWLHIADGYRDLVKRIDTAEAAMRSQRE